MQDVKTKNSGFQPVMRYRSLFWPLLLILIGGVWLLQNFGIITGANIAALLRLWPILLIVGGVEILLAPRQPRLAAFIGVGALVAALGIALVGPAFGLGKVEVTTKEFTAPLDKATAARVDLNLSVGKANVAALLDSPNLIDANLTYVGAIDFKVSGDTDKRVTLKQSENSGWNWFNTFDNNELQWNVALNPTIPLALNIKGGVGPSTLELGKLNLASLSINAGVGESTLTLPASDKTYNVTIDGGVGGINATLPANTSVNISINGGVGNATLDVPADAAVQVISNSGLGKINVPSNFTLLTDGSGKNRNGTYETPDFSSAKNKIVITYDGGVGNLTIR
ncbi:MAG: DUF5668 domain-containing protein [Chloroflexota bacterium]